MAGAGAAASRSTYSAKKKAQTMQNPVSRASAPLWRHGATVSTSMIPMPAASTTCCTARHTRTPADRCRPQADRNEQPHRGIGLDLMAEFRASQDWADRSCGGRRASSETRVPTSRALGVDAPIVDVRRTVDRGGPAFAGQSAIGGPTSLRDPRATQRLTPLALSVRQGVVASRLSAGRPAACPVEPVISLQPGILGRGADAS